ncbi:hypothetical protein [Psychrobacter sp. S1-30-MNA-CIBAN-0213]|uniref:hypothetical protein n=1 Tax=Psychrobacter sp. S1-30-MNA-CIBAN-0213 TaxID=3140456 RepID=UPI003317523B
MTSKPNNTSQPTPYDGWAGNQYRKPSRKHAKRKSYYKKYREQRKPNQSQARGTR